MIPVPSALVVVTEAEFQTTLVKLIKVYGLRYHHQKISFGSAAGWPDLTILGRRIIFRELKRETGKLTPAQAQWGEWLTQAGQDWGLWRPSDLASGRVQRELEAIR